MRVATGVPSSTVRLTVQSRSCERRTTSGRMARAASPPLTAVKWPADVRVTVTVRCEPADIALPCQITHYNRSAGSRKVLAHNLSYGNSQISYGNGQVCTGSLVCMALT